MRFAVQFVGPGSVRKGGLEAYAAERRLPATLAIQDSPEGTQITLLIRLRAMLVALGGALLLAYAGGGLALAWWLRQKPHNRIQTADIMLPWRWGGLRDLRGQMFSAQGMEALRERRLGPGVFLLRRGLAARPDDPAARQVLAEALAGVRDYEGVREVVLGQLPFPPVPRALLEVLATEAARVDDFATLADALERVLASGAATPADRRWALIGRAEALLRLQRPQAALAVLSDPSLVAVGDIAELRVNALCALGRAPEAIALAAGLPRSQGGDRERQLRLLAWAHQAAGHRAELAAALAELIALQPTEFAPRLFAIKRLWAARMEAEAQRELDALLRRVSARPGAIVFVANELADDDAPALVQRCVDEASGLGQPLPPLLALLALAHVSTAQWDGAEQAFQAMFGATRKYSEAEIRSREWLRAVIDAGAVDSPKNNAELKTAVGGERFSLASYVRTARGYARAQRWEGLQTIAEAGLAHYRRSGELQRRADEARAQLGGRARAAAGRGEVAAAEATRVTAPGAPAAGSPAAPRGPEVAKLDGAGFLARVAEHLAREDWDAAADLLAAARRVEPAWLREVEPECDWHDARIALAREDRLRAAQAIGFALKRARPDVERALALAREFEQRGNVDGARTVVRKVVEIAPTPPARLYLAELEPKEDTNRR